MRKARFPLPAIFGLVLAALFSRISYAEQINGRGYIATNGDEMMGKISTPVKYKAWILANRGYLIGAGWVGFKQDLRGGRWATCEENPRQRFKDYFPKWSYDKWHGKRKPRGLERWLNGEALKVEAKGDKRLLGEIMRGMRT